MDFPIIDLMDRDACYQKLLDLLHPQGLACPRCAAGDGHHVHRRRPDSPVVDYRCKGCRRVFNVFTGTPWQGTHFSPATILSILRGIGPGDAHREAGPRLGLSRPRLLRLRHEIQARELAGADRSPLPDDRTEADGMYQNAGEKTGATHRPARPSKAAGEPGQGPRHLGYRPACGTGGGWPHQRSAVGPGGSRQRGGRVGRRHGPAGHRAGGDGVNRRVERVQAAGSLWSRAATVNHNRGEFARDDDGDGVREMHCNTLEGIWTGLRSFLRPFRGVNKAYLEQYIIMFQWGYNLKAATDAFLRVLLGCPVTTKSGT